MKIAHWLLGICLLIFLMVVIGGLTRLTGSGLSMVNWHPATGFIPPFTEAHWQALFDSYKQYPQYLKLNLHMNLVDFKGIFWLEFIHRVLGRVIGLAFLLPFLYFWFRGMITRNLAPKLIIMFILGGLQGLLGWYMVKSGLVNDPHVSQYRLTAHLMLAVAIYSYALWVALDLLKTKKAEKTTTDYSVNSEKIIRISLVILVLVIITMVSGGFVAGLKAGLIYNTFPLMGDSLIAPGVYSLSPWYLSALEDAATVQFNHRLLAVTTFILLVAFYLSSRRQNLSLQTKSLLLWMLLASILQVSLGISTLLMRVPLLLAASHQAGALILLTTLLLLIHHLMTEKQTESNDFSN